MPPSTQRHGLAAWSMSSIPQIVTPCHSLWKQALVPARGLMFGRKTAKENSDFKTPPSEALRSVPLHSHLVQIYSSRPKTQKLCLGWLPVSLRQEGRLEVVMPLCPLFHKHYPNSNLQWQNRYSYPPCHCASANHWLCHAGSPQCLSARNPMKIHHFHEANSQAGIIRGASSLLVSTESGILVCRTDSRSS